METWPRTRELSETGEQQGIFMVLNPWNVLSAEEKEE